MKSLTDRDPGDETKTHSYYASYTIDGFLFTRAFLADDEEHAKEQAIDAVEFGELFIEVTKGCYA